MSARFLASYTSVVLLIATLVAAAITWVPARQSAADALTAGLGCAAWLFAGLAILLTRLPREHWSNRSHAVRVALAVPALCASLLLFISVG